MALVLLCCATITQPSISSDRSLTRTLPSFSVTGASEAAAGDGASSSCAAAAAARVIRFPAKGPRWKTEDFDCASLTISSRTARAVSDVFNNAARFFSASTGGAHIDTSPVSGTPSRIGGLTAQYARSKPRTQNISFFNLYEPVRVSAKKNNVEEMISMGGGGYNQVLFVFEFFKTTFLRPSLPISFSLNF